MYVKYNWIDVDSYLKNELYAKGYRYCCDGDIKLTSKRDSKDGMPLTEFNVYFFDNKEEAETFATQQINPFTLSPVVIVELPPHSMTLEEWL